MCLKRRLFSLEKMEKEYYIYTDGSCSPNPGNGGWAAMMEVHLGGKVQEEKYELSGSRPCTTNNKMELLACIEALRCMQGLVGKHHPTQLPSIHLTTDSQYVKQSVTQWIHGWKRSGWINSKGQPVANQDEIKELDSLHQELGVIWHWVKGHNKHPQNEWCDKEANRQRELLTLKDQQVVEQTKRKKQDMDEGLPQKKSKQEII